MARPLVAYEYAAKEPIEAHLNFGWRILDDGAYERARNGKGALRPDGAGVYWYEAWKPTSRLTDAQLDGVRALVAELPYASAVHRSSGATPRGDWSRLTVARPDGDVVIEVEDRCWTEHEAWMGRLLALLMPAAAAATRSGR